MQITNGKVSFTRSVKPADYEKKEATVELSFVIAEEDNPEKWHSYIEKNKKFFEGAEERKVAKGRAG
mgnify:CR=1 FL=1